MIVEREEDQEGINSLSSVFLAIYGTLPEFSANCFMNRRDSAAPSGSGSRCWSFLVHPGDPFGEPLLSQYGCFCHHDLVCTQKLLGSDQEHEFELHQQSCTSACNQRVATSHKSIYCTSSTRRAITAKQVVSTKFTVMYVISLYGALSLLTSRKGQLGERLWGRSYASCESGLAKRRLDNFVDVAGHPTNV